MRLKTSIYNKTYLLKVTINNYLSLIKNNLN